MAQEIKKKKNRWRMKMVHVGIQEGSLVQYLQ